MEKINLEQDIKVLCVKAASFPEDALNAHQKLHALLSRKDKRNYFGISAPDIKGKIIYKAAAEIIAVPCWSSCMIGILQRFFNSVSI